MAASPAVPDIHLFMRALARGQPDSALDADGSAIVIHARADDYRSNPGRQCRRSASPAAASRSESARLRRLRRQSVTSSR